MKVPKTKFIFDRRRRSAKNKPGSVELRVTYERVQKFVTTGVSVFPSQWDDKAQQVYNCFEAPELNLILAGMKKKTLQIISGMMEKGQLDIAAIPSLLRQQVVSMSFLDYMMLRIQRRQVGEHTHKSYITLYNKVSEFGKLKSFQDITAKNIRAFSEWLHAYEREIPDIDTGKKKKVKYSQATIYKLTSNLSLFISDAVMDGYLAENPYISKRMTESKGGTRIEQYLTPKQVRAIEKAKMPTAAVARARDLFLLQCQTGLAYIDLMTYDFKPDEKNVCRGRRHKTGTEFVFILTKKAQAILKKFDYTIPKMPNQKYNSYLKIVGQVAGIEMPLTSHIGRRTAGSIWLNKGISVDIVAKCLGHQSIQVTQRAYAKILDTTVVEAFRKAGN